MTRAGAARRRALPPALAVIALCSALLVGCAPDAAEPPPAPAESTPPTFTSDEEALAAAETAYTQYLATLDDVLSMGGQGNDQFADVATGQALEAAIADAKSFQESGLTTTGQRTADNFTLQEVSTSTVSFYVCEDITNVQAFDAAGNSAVSADRPNRQAFSAAMSVRERVITSRDFWSGGGIC